MKTLLVASALGILAVVAVLAILIFFGKVSPRTTNPRVKQGAFKILVRENGFYRVSLADLETDAGSVASAPFSAMHLSTGGQPVHFHIDGQDMIFYGRQSDSRYSAMRAYILDFERSGPQMEPVSAVPGEASVSTVPQRIHLEQNLVYDGRARMSDGGATVADEPWFWATIQTGEMMPIEFSLPETLSSAAGIRIRLWGATHNSQIDPDHDFELFVNDQSVGAIRWDGEEYLTSELEIPSDILRPGANTIVLDNSDQGSAPLDIFKLDWIELAVGLKPVAVGGRAEVEDVAGSVEILGFEDEPLLFEISSPDQPAILEGWDFLEGAAEIDVSGDMHVVALSPDSLRTPERISALRQSDLRKPHNQADLIIIASDELLATLRPLVDAREEQGLSVTAVSSQEIYDEFGYGDAGPASISAFLRFAFEQWEDPNPSYLLLVGEATYDYRGYLGEQLPNLVPPPLIPVSFGGETVSDSRLADVNDDGIPDFAVGRWPVSDTGTLAKLVERTLAYEVGAAPPGAIFVADGTSIEFSSLSDRVLASSNLRDEEVDKLYGLPQEAFADAWNDGAWLVSYAGHGSLDRWGKDDVFSIDGVGALRSVGPPPIVLQLTCLTGFFAHPTATSISEQMLLHPGGPVLLVAATSLTLSSSQEPFGASFLQELQDPRVVRIGDAFLRAKQSLDITNPLLQEVSDTFGLLGDPSTRIVRPEIGERAG